MLSLDVCFRRWETWIKAFWGLLSCFLCAEKESTYTATKSSPGTRERSEGETEQRSTLIPVPNGLKSRNDSCMYRVTWELVKLIGWQRVVFFFYTAQTALKSWEQSQRVRLKRVRENDPVVSLLCKHHWERWQDKMRAVETIQRCQDWLTEKMHHCPQH